ncbi:MAG TPA: penicillin acylase family protein [Longimicrobiales bacterium]|nr:penicillin acylase family protein [Longimicrobiales bacterium]
MFELIHPRAGVRRPATTCGLRLRNVPLLSLLVLTAACATAPVRPGQEPADISRQVEIRRTSHGVPHILAENLRAAAFGIAYVQLEDHGDRTIRSMEAARGRMARIEGKDAIDADATARLALGRALVVFDSLNADTRDYYTGFAEGINHYIRLHRDELPSWARPDFTPQQILARDIVWPGEAVMRRFRERVIEQSEEPPLLIALDDDAAYMQEPQNVGSNAWALAPSRTTSGNAILLRNPHLRWSAGYYEAHVRVPGKLDWYGDFRIGGPFDVIGGFSPHLGFATTNAATRSHEFYAFRLDPNNPEQFLLDGRPQPIRRVEVEVDYVEDGQHGTVTREQWWTELGPVVARKDTLLYVYRPATQGAYREGERWLEMIKATSFEEWKDAMRIQPRGGSNFTYADADGNIFIVWESPAPLLPHPPGGDTLAVFATRSDQVWSRLAPFDSLPQHHNPPGGYVHNENDSPHYANLNAILPHDFPFYVEPPRFRLRSQHGAMLLHNDRTFSLEDVVDAKHSMRMLLADRVKDDLVEAVRASSPTGDVARAIEFLAGWDNTAARASRGGVLFETWWDRYRSLVPEDSLYEADWTAAEPAQTPRGLGVPARAVEAFAWAVPETAQRYGSWDVAWGDVHRVRRGDVDVPVGGCGGALGCFRVLNFEEAPDGKRVVNGGDGWVIAVEFAETPRAYSVLAYGQSPDPTSPWHDDQAALFAANRMKPVRFTEEDIAADLVMRYHPGEEREVAQD